MSILIILFLLIGLGLRLIAIEQSFWLDEAISIQTATGYSAWQIITQFSPTDFNPPLYYIVLHFWLKIFPPTEFFIRLPSVIFGIITALFIYKIYFLVFKNKNEALLTFILLLTSSLHVYYSQEARMYALVTFAVTGSIYYFLKILRKRKLLDIILYLIFNLLMIYSHYLSWLVLVAQFIYLFFYQKDKFKNFSILYIIIFLFYLPWLPTLLQQLKIGERLAVENVIWSKIAGGLSFKTIILLPIKFIIGRTAFENKNFYLTIVLILGGLFGFLLWQSLREKQNRFLKLIWLWLIIPPICGIFISLKIPVFSYFRFLFCLPAFYILITRGIFKFHKPEKIALLIVIINLFFSFRYLLNNNFHRENWKKAVTVLHEKNKEKAPILIIKNITAPFEYYDNNKTDLIFFNQKELTTHESTIWLIPYAQPIFDPQDTTRSFLRAKGFQRTYEEHFRGVTLEKWQKLVAYSYN